MYTIETFPLSQKAIVRKDGRVIFHGDIQLACKFCEDNNIQLKK